MPIPGSILSIPIDISGSVQLWPDLGTVVDRNEGIDGSGSPVKGVPIPDPNMTDIKCRVAPLILLRPTDTEHRGDAVTIQDEDRHISLHGFFPDINPQIHDFVVGALSYRILGVEFDGNLHITRLKAAVLRP